MIPNAWVAYKLTKKTLSNGKGKPRRTQEDELQDYEENLKVLKDTLKWMIILYIIYVVLALISTQVLPPSIEYWRTTPS